MEGLVRGDVVVLEFPFTDLTTTKRRPAFVVAVLPGDDIILARITSRPTPDRFAVALGRDSFASGGLIQDSYVSAGKLFTMDRGLVLYSVGRTTTEAASRVLDSVVSAVRH